MTNSIMFTSTELEKRWRIKPVDLLVIIQNKHLKYTNEDRFTFFPEYSLDDMKHAFFNILDIEALEEKFPDLKPQDEPYITAQGEIPPYLNKNNKHFSKELSIAIETWLAIYGTSGCLKSGKHKKQIKAYLQQYHPGLSKEAIERISTMINWDNKGGAEKIGS